MFFVKRDSILLNSYDFYYKLKNFLFEGGYKLDNRRPHCQRLQAGIQGRFYFGKIMASYIHT